MNTAPDITTPTMVAATDQTNPAAAVRIKLQSHGFAIDHPDQVLGERLMENALGVAEAMLVAQMVSVHVMAMRCSHTLRMRTISLSGAARALGHRL